MTELIRNLFGVESEIFLLWTTTLTKAIVLRMQFNYVDYTGQILGFIFIRKFVILNCRLWDVLKAEKRN